MTDARWLSPTELDAWMQLAALMMTLPSSLDSQLEREEGLNLAEYMVLAMLSEQEPAELRMSHIATLINASPSRLSRIAGRLEKNGYIRREMAADDRRSVIAQLTPAGRAKIDAAAPGHVAEVRARVFDRLTPEQVTQLTDIGRAIFGGDCTPPSPPR